MGKNNVYIGLIAVFLINIASSCVHGTDGSGSMRIDMLPLIANDVSNDIEKVGLDVEFIPLETNDSLLLGGNTIVKYVDQDNIIVESLQTLYRFDRQGKFLNRIGRKGQGPGEYVSPGRVSFDPVARRLYLFTNRSLQEWSLEGEYVRTLEMPDRESLQSVSAMLNDTLVMIRRYYGDEGELTETVQWSRIDGKSLIDKVIMSDSTKIDVAMYASPEHYRVGECEFFRDEWDNKLFRLKYPDMTEFVWFDFGRHNTDRSIFQSGNLREKLGDENVSIKQCIVSGDYKWMKYRLENLDRYVLIGKNNECLYHSTALSPRDTPSGLPVVDGMMLSFWPTYIDDQSRLSCVVYPDMIDDQPLEYLSKVTGTEIDPDSNPVVALAWSD